MTECRQLRKELGQDEALGLQILEAPRFSKRARQMETEMELYCNTSPVGLRHVPASALHSPLHDSSYVI